MNATTELPGAHDEIGKAPHVVDLYLLLGRMLFNFGATAKRIQDSIACLARHLGCKVDMLVSYDVLLITVNDGATFRTRIDSGRRFAGLNLLGLARVSACLRGLPHSESSPEAIERALCAIRDTPPVHSVAAQTFAAGCTGAAFCVVNGGDPASWVGSFIAAAFIFAIRRPLATRNFNVYLTLFAIALSGSLLAGLLGRMMQTSTPAIALIAPLLFVAVLVALCLGLGLTLDLVPPLISSPFALPAPWDIVLLSLAAAVAAGALACLNNGGASLIALCALGGLTGRLVRVLLSLSGLDVITASLIGVLSSTLVVGFIADRLRWSAVVASVMAALPMVPGYFAIAGMHSLLSFAAASAADPQQLSAGLQALLRAFFISIALVVGVIGPVIVLQRNTERV